MRTGHVQRIEGETRVDSGSEAWRPAGARRLEALGERPLGCRHASFPLSGGAQPAEGPVSVAQAGLRRLAFRDGPVELLREGRSQRLPAVEGMRVPAAGAAPLDPAWRHDA